MYSSSCKENNELGGSKMYYVYIKTGRTSYDCNATLIEKETLHEAECYLAECKYIEANYDTAKELVQACISGNIDVLPTVDAYVKEYYKSDMHDYADIVSDAITNEFEVMKYIGSDEDDYINTIEESAIIEGTKLGVF